MRAPIGLVALPLLALSARAQVTVDAGPDQRLPPMQRMAVLSGTATNLTPLDFWIADGDGALENYLLKYDDVTGVTAVGPLKTTGGQIFGWPSDMEHVGAVVYGIETFHRKLYTLDANTGICTPVGAQVSYTGLSCLAYDAAGDKLYSVDSKTRKLLKFDRSTGKATVILTLPAAHTDVRGLAFRKSDGKLYYCDDATEAIYRVDPATAKNEFVLALNDGPDALVDELDFYGGKLYASYRTIDRTTGIWSMRVARIDLEEGEAEFVGPVISDCSAHTLKMNSIPETIRWVQTGGPAQALIVRPGALTTAVYFPMPGPYRFELQAIGNNKTTRDDMIVRVPPPWFYDPNLGPQTSH
jgi:hypothetical protein